MRMDGSSVALAAVAALTVASTLKGPSPNGSVARVPRRPVKGQQLPLSNLELRKPPTFAQVVAGVEAVPAQDVPIRASRDRARQYQSSVVPQGYAARPQVREARGVVSRAKAQGERLGRGNFGETFLVSGLVVKLPAEKDMHGRTWGPEIRGYFEHEAGVAQELRAAGHTIVPRIVYVGDPPHGPALVREYGEPIDHLGDGPGGISVAELAKLEADLFAVEASGDWEVADELLVLRRTDGSIFIGDVGFWRRRNTADSMWISDVPSLVARFARTLGMGDEAMKAFGALSLGTLYSIGSWFKILEGPSVDPDLIEFFSEEAAPFVLQMIRAREALGLPYHVSAEVLLDRLERALAPHGAVIQDGRKSFRHAADLHHALMKRRLAARKQGREPKYPIFSLHRPYRGD
jgi:hypothetical protein